MLYRRKIALALLQGFGDKLSLTDFQKLAFLFSEKQSEPSFDFVPYKYGCYSFQLDRDRQKMVETGLLANKNEWVKNDSRDYVKLLSNLDYRGLLELRKEIGNMRGDDLIRYVYTNYPYYAIHSTIAAEILSEEEMESVLDAVPTQEGFCLFTIGYEGKTIEAYVNQLIQYRVRVLCDVRKNPLSRKYGFSKQALKRIVERFGISYIHFPDLGISSNKRKGLSTNTDYTALFDEYERETLPNQRAKLHQIADILETNERIALTCFELDHKACHRNRVVHALQKLSGWRHPVKHIS